MRQHDNITTTLKSDITVKGYLPPETRTMNLAELNIAGNSTAFPESSNSTLAS